MPQNRQFILATLKAAKELPQLAPPPQQDAEGEAAAAALSSYRGGAAKKRKNTKRSGAAVAAGASPEPKKRTTVQGISRTCRSAFGTDTEITFTGTVDIVDLTDIADQCGNVQCQTALIADNVFDCVA